MIVLWDLDDTLVEWTAQSVANLLADPVVAHIATLPRTSFDLFEHARTEEEIAGVQRAHDAPGFYRHLEPRRGAKEALEATEAAGHINFIVSTPWRGQHTSPSEKTQAVEEYFGPQWVRRLILTHDKTLVNGDVLIDDRPTIKGVARPRWNRIMVDQPYNQVPLEWPPEHTMNARTLRTFDGFENLPVLLEWVSHIRQSGHSIVRSIDDSCGECLDYFGQAHPR